MQLSSRRFGTDFVDSLPADPEAQNFTRQVTGAAYSLVIPSPVAAPRLLGWSESLAAQFSLPRAAGADVELLGGNLVLPGMKPFAARYGGHQFGNWAGQLGDGRAIGLGSLLDKDGTAWEFQLKGAGPTPYSRRADGRAVLRSSIREFICSEAMHALGVPTTRALSVVTTGEEVVRDMFYDGNPAPEPGAIVCRVSPSFLRFGNFDLPAAKGEMDLLRKLADYTIDRFYPEVTEAGPARYVELFRAVALRTARLINEWMRVGFVHGVMNTDNLSILGLTIDYGPYGWIDDYDPSWTPNTTDLPGRRYCYGRQPQIAQWNLAQLAGALAPLCPDLVQGLQDALNDYGQEYTKCFLSTMSAKLGLKSITSKEDEKLLEAMEGLLRSQETDMTLFFRGLVELPLDAPVVAIPAWLENAFYSGKAAQEQAWLEWLEFYRGRVNQDEPDLSARQIQMNSVNPLYVPRNYLVQEAIEAAERGDGAPLAKLFHVLQHPYAKRPGGEHYAAKRPDWARAKPGCSTLSCSS